MVRLSRPSAWVRVRVTPVCTLALARGSGLCREQGARMRPTPPGHLPRKSSPLTVGSVRAVARICPATPDRADRSGARRVVDPQPRQALGRRGRRGAGRRPPRLHRRSPVSRRQAHRSPIGQVPRRLRGPHQPPQTPLRPEPSRLRGHPRHPAIGPTYSIPQRFRIIPQSQFATRAAPSGAAVLVLQRSRFIRG
jgi:hypothetical protein